MTPIKGYNQYLNESYDYQIAYETWHEYRRTIKRLICSEGPVVGQVGIVGAGYLNDIDLSMFNEKQVKLHLMDCDPKAMTKGVKHQNYSGLVQNYGVDLTGLDSGHFFEEMVSLLSHSHISGVESKLQEWSIQPNIPLGKDSLDVLLISPIYTQLLLQQFLDLVILTGNSDALEQLTEVILSFLVRVIDQLNESLNHCLKKGGKLVVWSDIMAFNPRDESYKKIANSPSQSLLIERAVKSYETQYGKGVGSYGLENIRDKMCSENNCIEDFFIWPFDQDRHLFVKGIYSRK